MTMPPSQAPSWNQPVLDPPQKLVSAQGQVALSPKDATLESNVATGRQLPPAQVQNHLSLVPVHLFQVQSIQVQRELVLQAQDQDFLVQVPMKPQDVQFVSGDGGAIFAGTKQSQRQRKKTGTQVALTTS